MSDHIKAVRGWIEHSRRIVALTGAGISTESGIPDFVDPRAYGRKIHWLKSSLIFATTWLTLKSASWHGSTEFPIRHGKRNPMLVIWHWQQLSRADACMRLSPRILMSCISVPAIRRKKSLRYTAQCTRLSACAATGVGQCSPRWNACARAKKIRLAKVVAEF